MRKVVLAAALLVLAGCTSEPEPALVQKTSPPPWTEPANYTFVADRTCDGATSDGKYKVTVAGGEVTATERVDGKTAEGEEEIEVPTLGGMLEEVRTAIEDGADATSRAGAGRPPAGTPATSPPRRRYAAARPTGSCSRPR